MQRHRIRRCRPYLLTIIFDDLYLEASKESCTCWIILHHFCISATCFVPFDLVVPHCLEKCRPAVMLATRWDPTHPTCISETLAMCVWSSRPNFSTWSWESRKFDLKPAQLISINHPNPNYFHQLDQPVLDQILAWHSYLEALTKALGMDGNGLFWVFSKNTTCWIWKIKENWEQWWIVIRMFMLPKNNERSWWALLCNRSWTSCGFTKHRLIFPKKVEHGAPVQ